jgi:peroxin-3
MTMAEVWQVYKAKAVFMPVRWVYHLLLLEMGCKTEGNQHKKQRKRSFNSGMISRSVVNIAIIISKLVLISDTAITRAFTLIYTLALLTLLTRIQLNLLGRRNYLSSVISLATGGVEQSTISLENHDDDNPDQASGNDFDTNRRYLTFSWWLLHRGWREVMLKVEAAVNEVFGSVSPRDDVTMHRFSELTLEVRKRVEGATEADRQASRWLQYLLPPRDQEDVVLTESGMSQDPPPSEYASVSPSVASLRRLLDETSDLVDSPPFSHVLTMLLDAGFSTLVDQKIATEVFKIPATPDIAELSSQRVTEVFDPKPVRLPIVLGVLARQAHSIGNGVPNEYLQAMEQVRDLEAFAAVVYSSNWESEISPVNGDGNTRFMQKDGASGSEVIAADSQVSTETAPDQESIVDVGAQSVFESAWDKASENVEKSGLTE